MFDNTSSLLARADKFEKKKKMQQTIHNVMAPTIADQALGEAIFTGSKKFVDTKTIESMAQMKQKMAEKIKLEPPAPKVDALKQFN